MERSTQIVVDLLGKGLSVTEVANVIGVSVSAISQLADKYEEKISSLVAEKTDAAQFLEDRMDALEGKLIEKIERTIPVETDALRLAKLFQTINGAKRRTRGEGLPAGTSITQNNVVQLNVGNFKKRQHTFQTNAQNEVVSVDGRNLSVASMKQVERLAAPEAPVEGAALTEAAFDMNGSTSNEQVTDVSEAEADGEQEGSTGQPISADSADEIPLVHATSSSN